MILFRIPSYVVAMVITLKFVFGSLDYTIDAEPVRREYKVF